MPPERAVAIARVRVSLTSRWRETGFWVCNRVVDEEHESDFESRGCRAETQAERAWLLDSARANGRVEVWWWDVAAVEGKAVVVEAAAAVVAVGCADASAGDPVVAVWLIDAGAEGSLVVSICPCREVVWLVCCAVRRNKAARHPASCLVVQLAALQPSWCCRGRCGRRGRRERRELLRAATCRRQQAVRGDGRRSRIGRSFSPCSCC